MDGNGVMAASEMSGSAEEDHLLPTASTFEDVFAASYDRMVRLAHLTTAGAAPAEEIVQDAFLQLYRAWPKVRTPEGYLRVAVVNGCRSWGRRRMVARRHPPPPPSPTLLDAEALAVRDALLVLTPRQRAAVVLRYYEDLREADIAAVLGCRPGTVKSLLSRSMSKLKGALNHD